MSKLRADYKAVWTSLSTTKEDAYMVVSGYTDEEKFHADAEDTLDILRATTGIRPDDVFLEIGCGVGRVGRVLAPLVREWIGCDVSPNMITLAGRRLIGCPMCDCKKSPVTICRRFRMLRWMWSTRRSFSCTSRSGTVTRMCWRRCGC